MQVSQPNPIIEIPEPDYGVVICDGSIHLESQSPINSLVVSVSFVIVCKSSSKMGSNEADASVGEVETNGTASLVAGDS